MTEESNFQKYREKVKNLFQVNKFSSFIEVLEKGLEQELNFHPFTTNPPIPIEKLPVDLSLRKSGIFRKIYESIFPVSHVFQATFRYEDLFLENFMPITNKDFIGRGSYKFVYKLPWNQVLKVGKSKLGSDPIFGGLFKEVSKNLEVYLKPEEMELKKFLQAKCFKESSKELLDFKFKRLGLERLHYWKLKNLLPDLVLPTKYFMGIRYRKTPWGVPFTTVTPCDNQLIIPGKHLKEFVLLKEKEKQNPLESKILPKWKLNFNTHKFGQIPVSKLKKIAFNFHRVIEATRYLANKEKLILDLHSENIIIMLPEFELKIFDFHVFDEHLYEPGENGISPEEEHINTINQFIESFELGKNQE